MPSFSGIIDEYPRISIDNFIPLVASYFISHLHLDHIEGVEDFLPLPNIKIYTSVTTAKLISGRYSDLKQIIPYVQALEIGKTHIISLPQLTSTAIDIPEQVKVTLIPTSHCLGSVMFLINGKNGKVLYTGDFRIPMGTSSVIKNQYKIDRLESIYLDTTFLNRNCLYFPSRERSVLTMLDLVTNFLAADPANIVHININTRYSLEVLYYLIYLRLNIKVHVMWDYYAQLSELDPCFLTCIDHVNHDSRVHACHHEDNKFMNNVCKKKFAAAKETNNFLKLQPTTLWWAERGAVKDYIVHRINRHSLRVCFSSHSSYMEIVDLLMTLPARNIKDCVSTSNDDLKSIQEKLLIGQF